MNRNLIDTMRCDETEEILRQFFQVSFYCRLYASMSLKHALEKVHTKAKSNRTFSNYEHINGQVDTDSFISTLKLKSHECYMLDAISFQFLLKFFSVVLKFFLSLSSLGL